VSCFTFNCYAECHFLIVALIVVYDECHVFYVLTAEYRLCRILFFLLC
jgi:hypothetical protein